MSKILVVNENMGSDDPGDIMIFSGPEAASSYLEPIDIRNKEFVGVFENGIRAEFIFTDKGSVVVREGKIHDSPLLKRYIEYVWNASPLLRDTPVPSSIGQAAKIIGFQK